MIAIIAYILLGLISGFIAYWIGYKMSKIHLEAIYLESPRYRNPPTHEEVKARVVKEDMTVIILSIILWPVVLFVIYPVIGCTIIVSRTFNWIIDKLEGGKYK